jgi:Flp pilus assembly protein TadG
MSWCRRRERGSVSVEMAVMAPAFAMLLFSSIWYGRIAVAANAIDAAAHDAARAASISRTQSEADAAARNAALETLQQQPQRPNCADGLDVDPDTDAFNQDGVDLAFVSVTITCDVSFTDIAFPGVPQTWRVTSTFISPIDVFRERP